MGALPVDTKVSLCQHLPVTKAPRPQHFAQSVVMVLLQSVLGPLLYRPGDATRLPESPVPVPSDGTPSRRSRGRGIDVVGLAMLGTIG
jgi:hypothetical protein